MEKQFVEEIKRKRPTLKGVLPIMKKYGMHPKQKRTRRIFLDNNLVIYLKKDKMMRNIQKKSAKNIAIAYKEIRTNF
jgi:hypothetical protein